MSRYATQAAVGSPPAPGHQPIVNAAGGTGYAQSSRLELVSLLLTSFMQDEHYRSAAATQLRLKELVAAVDPVFAAKAAVYARDTFGMRSVSHVVAAELGRLVKGQPWTRRFFDRVVLRPDDVTEIVSCYLLGNQGVTRMVKNDKGQTVTKTSLPIPNAMKRGLGDALARFNEYQVAKYRGDGHAFKLVDAVNLLHPQATPALTGLVKGTLQAPETWETKLSAAGQQDDGEVEDAKAQVWKDLLVAGKLGYLAALRNVRNIADQADQETRKLLCSLLVDEKALRRARIFPFQLLKAYEAIEASVASGKMGLLGTLSDALDLSVANVPKFDGRSAILLDTSGSMQGEPAKIGSIFTATLAKAWGADVVIWASSARYVSFNPRDSVMTVARNLPFDGGGTDLSSAFRLLHQKYDRVVVLSDMQTWLDPSGAQPAWRAYCAKFGCKPHLYSFDLKNYGQLAIPEDRVYCLAGYSDRIFETMGKLEMDREALLHAVEAVNLMEPSVKMKVRVEVPEPKAETEPKRKPKVKKVRK